MNEKIMQAWKGWCKAFFQLFKQIFEGSSSTFLSGEPYEVQLSKYRKAARVQWSDSRKKDDLSEVQIGTSFQRRVGNPDPIGYTLMLQEVRRHEGLKRMLEYVEIESKSLDDTFIVLIESVTSDRHCTQCSTPCSAARSKQSPGSTNLSINYEQFSRKIRAYLVSLISSLERGQGSPVSNNRMKPTEEWGIVPYPFGSDMVERGSLTLPSGMWSERSEPELDDTSSQGVSERNELIVKATPEPISVRTESIASTRYRSSLTSETAEINLQNVIESSPEVTDAKQKTLKDIFVSIENIGGDVLLENAADELNPIADTRLIGSESVTSDLHSETLPYATEVVNCEQAPLKVAEALGIKEFDESIISPIPDNTSLKQESSTSITFKGINNNVLYMPQIVASDFGMIETAHNWDVNWTHDFVSFHDCRRMKSHQRINHFPGSICLSSKDILGKNLNVMNGFFPRDYDFFPKTWFVPEDIAKINRYTRRNKEAVFIVKPHDGGAGSGIKITSSLREINSYNKIVCQLYIQRPFLIDGYKFDFRVYVLMTSIKPLRIFVHKEGLARFATLKYEKPSAINSSKKWMHLTNTCLNKKSPFYIRHGSVGSTRRITNVFQWFVDNEIDVGKIQASMDDAIIKTIIVGLPLLRHFYRLSFPCHSTSISCFELMGFDIMLDQKLKLYLLEVNVAPSFANETGTSHVARIKQEVVYDAFRILNLMNNEKHNSRKGKMARPEGRISRSQGFKMKPPRLNEVKYSNITTQSRIDWENKHLGNFRKIYPPEAHRGRYYQKFIDKAISSLGPTRYGRDIELTSEQKKWLT